MKTIGLKGASGLGDSIYGYPICKYYSERYDIVHYMTNYPELFKSLDNVVCHEHKKLNYISLDHGVKQPVDIRFTYCGRKYTPGTDQYTDSLMSAKISDDLPLSIPWNIQNKELIKTINKKNFLSCKPICLLSAPYEPFGRDDEWGKLLRIDPNIMQSIVDKYKKDVFFIQIGNRYTLHKIDGVHMDLVNETTVSDIMDLASYADISLSQIGNALPIAEAVGKKSFTVFSDKALRCENRFISAITPEKVVHYKDRNTSVIDNNIKKAVESFGKAII